MDIGKTAWINAWTSYEILLYMVLHTFWGHWKIKKSSLALNLHPKSCALLVYSVMCLWKFNFCFAKNQCTHISSVLSPECRKVQRTWDTSKKKDKIYYKKLAQPVYVYPAEIFCPAVPVNQDQLFLTDQEYQLSDSIW